MNLRPFPVAVMVLLALASPGVAQVADHDTLLRRLGGDDIERLAGGHAQTSPLADGEMMHAGMLAQHASRAVDDFAPRAPFGTKQISCESGFGATGIPSSRASSRTCGLV